MSLAAGQPAPDFRLPAECGEVGLADWRGQWLVLYFYPKDATSGCTAEAIAFRDDHARFRAAGADILGVSRDSPSSHAKFRAKLDLPFRLASDGEGTLCQAYGTWVSKSMYGRSYMGIERATFLIDGSGIIRAVWRKVKVPGHAAQVLAAIGAS